MYTGHEINWKSIWGRAKMERSPPSFACVPRATFVKRRRTEIASRVAAAEEFRGHRRRQAVARQRGLEGCYSGQRSARRQLCKGGIAAPPLSNTQTLQRGREPNTYLFVMVRLVYVCVCVLIIAMRYDVKCFSERFEIPLSDVHDS